jgi:hypothetical protein
MFVSILEKGTNIANEGRFQKEDFRRKKEIKVNTYYDIKGRYPGIFR